MADSKEADANIAAALNTAASLQYLVIVIFPSAEINTQLGNVVRLPQKIAYNRVTKQPRNGNIGMMKRLSTAGAEISFNELHGLFHRVEPLAVR